MAVRGGDSHYFFDVAMKRRVSYFFVVYSVILFFAGCSTPDYQAPVEDRHKPQESVDSGGRWVTVRKGDTLFSISFAHGRSHLSVAKLNGIKPPYTIYPGQRIKVSGKLPPDSVNKTQVAADTPGKKTDGSQVVKKDTKMPRVAAVKSSVKWNWPADGKVIRAYPKKAPRKKGIGISGRHGQEVQAAAAGEIVYVGNGIPGYGNLIIVKHSETYLSAYAHSLELFVKEGQQVKKGQKVALMGDNESGQPMLHFEIRRHGKPVNPLNYLPGR